MAKAPAAPSPDAVMSGADMKPVLSKSKHEPVSAAIAFTEAKEGVILLSAKKKPKKVLSDLRADARKAGLRLDNSSVRFGKAEVDAEVDASLVIFTINKEPPGGIEPKLKLQLRGSGCTKVEFKVDAALENEPEDDEQNATAASAATQQPAPTAQPPAPAPTAAPTPGPAQTAEQTQAQPAGPDGAALTHELAALIPQIPGAAGTDRARLGALGDLARAAGAAIRSGDLAAAAATIGQLRTALANGGQPAASAQAASAQAASASPAAANLEKSAAIWLAARKKVETDVEKLRAAIVDAYKDEGIGTDLDKAYSVRLRPLISQLDDSLAVKLAQAGKEAAADKRAELVREARALVESYEKALAAEPFIAELDRNPFMPLAVHQTLSGTLQALGKVIDQAAAPAA